MSFNKEEIIKMVRAHALIMQVPVDELMVGYGAAAVLHGVRESTGDIDVDVNVHTYKQVQEVFPQAIEVHGLIGPLLPVNIFMDVHPAEWKEEDTVVIDGIRLMSVERLIEAYKYLTSRPGRNPGKLEQDAATIRALQAL